MGAAVSDAVYDAGRQLLLDQMHNALTAAIPGQMPDQLRTYWTTGEGGTVKIRWGTDGSFERCERLLRKYFPRNPGGLCAKLHKRATGEWPAEKGIQSHAGPIADEADLEELLDGMAVGDELEIELAFDPNQPRAADGKWGGGGAKDPAQQKTERGMSAADKAKHLSDAEFVEMIVEQEKVDRGAAPTERYRKLRARWDAQLKKDPGALIEVASRTRKARAEALKKLPPKKKAPAAKKAAAPKAPAAKKAPPPGVDPRKQFATGWTAPADAETSFHLPGRHNQESHGNRVGKPGNVHAATGIGAAIRSVAVRRGQAEIGEESVHLEALRQSIKRAQEKAGRTSIPRGPGQTGEPIPDLTEKGAEGLQIIDKLMAGKTTLHGGVPAPSKGGVNENTVYNLILKGFITRKSNYTQSEVEITEKGRAALAALKAGGVPVGAAKQKVSKAEAERRRVMKGVKLYNPTHTGAQLRGVLTSQERESADTKLSALSRSATAPAAITDAHPYYASPDYRAMPDDMTRSDLTELMGLGLINSHGPAHDAEDKRIWAHITPAGRQYLADMGLQGTDPAEEARQARAARLDSTAGRKAVAAEYDKLSVDDFWAQSPERQQEIKADLRELLERGEYDRTTIRSNQTSMGTTIRNATPQHINTAREKLRQFNQPKPPPRVVKPSPANVRERLADATGVGAKEKLLEVAKELGFTDYRGGAGLKTAYLRKLLENLLFDREEQERKGLRADAREDEDMSTDDTLAAHAGHHDDDEVDSMDAALSDLDGPDEYAESLLPRYTKWQGMLAPIGKPTGDRRIFEGGALSNRDLPLPLLWQELSDDGHKRSSVVGTIDELDHREDGSYGVGRFLDPDLFPDAAKAMALLKARVNGPSVDLDDVTYAMKNADGTPFDMATFEAETLAGGDPAKPLLSVSAGRISAATLVSIPAFAEVAHTWTLTDEIDEDAFSQHLADDMDDCEDCGTQLVAAGYAGPPLAAFMPRELTGPTAPTIADDGVTVYGHLATWGTCHVGFQNACVTPPHSPANYAYFHTGEVTTAEGERLPVGRLVLGAPHADLAKGFRAAAQHYDDTGRVTALIRAYEDEFGIAFAGVMVHDLDAEGRAQFAAMPLSGDWRRVGGNLELIGAISVPVPGFPVARSTGAQATALVAAGVLHSPDAQPVDAGVRMSVQHPVEFTDDSVTIKISGRDLRAGGNVLDILRAALDRDAEAATVAGPDATADFAAQVQRELTAVGDTINRERTRLLDGLNPGE